jgi:hypothetical protein
MAAKVPVKEAPLFIFRECSATHFPTPAGGYFYEEQGWEGLDGNLLSDKNGDFNNDYFRYHVQSFPSTRAQRLGLVKSGIDNNTTRYI